MESSVPGGPGPSSPAPVSSQYQVGDEVVPGYTLVSQLGSGMAGDVWIAQAAGGVQVALKVIRSLAMVGGRKELRALKTIRNVKHPNLCPVFGFWTKDEQGRILADGETELLATDTVDFAPPAPEGAEGENGGIGATMSISSLSTPVDGPADGGERGGRETEGRETLKASAQQLIVVMGLGDRTLFDRLVESRIEAGIPRDDTTRPHGLDPVEAIRYLRASAGAIDLLNREHQIYHCDIKPQNILIVGGDAQVCDFGLANKIEGDMRKTQQAFATPAYAAPEVLQGQTYSRAVDQYSLAVTYYELRTGLLPFDVSTPANMVVAKCTGKLDLSHLTPAERKVMSRAMDVDPDRRYPSCTEFVTALARATGVEKSGGLSLARLFAGAAVAAACFAIGVATWRAVDPDGYAAAVATWRGVRTAEERLSDARQVIDASADVAYMSPENRLREAAALALGSTDARNEETRQRAIAASEQAIAFLDDKIREILEDRPRLDDDRLDTIERDLDWLDAELSRSDRDFGWVPRLRWRAWLNRGLLDQKHRGVFDSDATGRLASDPAATADVTGGERLQGAIATLLARAADAGYSVSPLIDGTASGGVGTGGNGPTDPGAGGTGALPVDADEPLRTSVIECERLVATVPTSELPAFYRDAWPRFRDASLAPLRRFVAETEAGSSARDEVMAAFPGLAAEAELSAAHRRLVARDIDGVRSHLNALAELDPAVLGETARAQQSWLREAVEAVDSSRAPLDSLRRMAEPDRRDQLRGVPKASVEALLEMVTARVLEATPRFPDAVELYRAAVAIGEVTGASTPAAERALLSTAIVTDSVTDEALDPLLRPAAVDEAVRRLGAAIGLERLARENKRPPQREVRQLRDVAIALSETSDDTKLEIGVRPIPPVLIALMLSSADVLLGDLSAAVERLQPYRPGAAGEAGDADKDRDGEVTVDALSAERRRWIAGVYLEDARERSGVEDRDLQHRYRQDDATLAERVAQAGTWLDDAESHPGWLQEAALVELANPERSLSENAVASFDAVEPADLVSPLLLGLLERQLDSTRPGRPQGSEGDRVGEIARLVRLAAETVRRFGDRQRSEIATATDFFAPVMERFGTVIRRTDAGGRGLPPSIDEGDAITFCLGMLESARGYGVRETFRQRGDPGPWYADLETAAALAATREENPRRASALWLEAAEYYRMDRDLQPDGWTRPGDVDPLDRYIDRARDVGGETPRIVLTMALTAERRSKVVVDNAERVAALDRAAELCDRVVEIADAGNVGGGQTGGTTGGSLGDRFDALWNQANILVQRAFYDASDRTRRLESAREKATEAIRMIERHPVEAQEWSTASAYSSLGNSCEDLGLYCYIADEDQALQMERFEQASEAFREAAKLTRGGGGFKEALYLARCLIRYHDNGGPKSLLDEADANLLEPDDDLSTDLRARWGMWRSALALRRGDEDAARRYAKDVFERLRHETAPSLLDEKNDAAIHYADLLYKSQTSDPQQILDVIGAVEEPSPKHRWKSLAVRMLALSDVGAVDKALACHDEMLRYAERDLVFEPELVIPPLGDGTLDLFRLSFPRDDALARDQMVTRLEDVIRAAESAASDSADAGACRALAAWAKGLRGLIREGESPDMVGPMIDGIEGLPTTAVYRRMRDEGRWNLWVYFSLITRTGNLPEVIGKLSGRRPEIGRPTRGASIDRRRQRDDAKPDRPRGGVASRIVEMRADGSICVALAPSESGPAALGEVLTTSATPSVAGLVKSSARRPCTRPRRKS